MVIVRATAVANALHKVIQDKQLFKMIQGKPHVLVEAWTLLGNMLGVFPVIVWTKPIVDVSGKTQGWEARCEARTRTGEIVGSAEAQCARDENMWGWHPKDKNGKPLTVRDEHALRSMAQTRARSKALSGPLGFVVTLAGYSATPAEEMPQAGTQSADASSAGKIMPKQHAKIAVLVKELEEKLPTSEGQLSWVAEIRERWKVQSRAKLTKHQAGEVIEWLEAQLEAAGIPF
jgi:hypothetical protein